MKISIIIPVYNTDRNYLSESLESCLNQTISDEVEVIAVNDGSTNGADKLLKEYADRYPALKLIDQKNQGTSVARNSGLEAALGDYIMFVDADDWIEEDCCEKALREAYRTNSDIVFFGYATNYTNREINRVLEKVPEGVFERESLQLAILKGNPAFGPVEVGAPWGKLIRASIIREDNIRYTPGLKKGQDTVFVLDLLEHCSTFSYFSYLGYHYRMLGSSVSHRYNSQIIKIMEKTLNAYSLFVDKYRKNEIFREAVRRKYYRVLVGEYLMLDFCHPDNKKKYSEKKSGFLSVIDREPYKKLISIVQVSGIYDKIQLFLIRKKSIALLFMIKSFEIFLRSLVIRQFGK
ncbi:MAG: glycosyltransferase [Lachnospiraceae bacterium]|nr:glycosyltransferase [Lachnospiraceae bacterium]